MRKISRFDPASTAQHLWRRCQSRLRPQLAFVLGSGFGAIADLARKEHEFSYADIPGFICPKVGGHQGRLILGQLEGMPVWILSGRSHYYEGHSLEEITFPIRVMAALKVRDIVLTNAAGGIHRKFRPGDFMSLDDHINWMGANPLRGEVPVGLERFVDLTRPYDEQLTSLVRQAARKVKIKMHRGVYLAVSGPSYETPAEIRAFGRLGADAVGMSTVPEVIVARQCGLRVAGISIITNLAAAKGNALLAHADVLAAGENARQRAAALVEQLVKLYAATG